MKKNRSFGLNIGASSILIIVVILSLVCFAGLSLSSANADYKLCKKLADRTTAYYEATSQAYRALALKKESSNENSFTDSFPINENQALIVSAVINPDSETNYVLTDFRIVTVKTPKIDDSLSLLLK